MNQSTNVLLVVIIVLLFWILKFVEHVNLTCVTLAGETATTMYDCSVN
jgi:hypothetical protein